MKLGLGTVQFGSDYGISNNTGQTSIEEAKKILEVAGANGIATIDTAALYGSSERVLGMILPVDHRFRIVTKTPRFGASRITPADADMLEESLMSSLLKLRCVSVYGLLLHNADDALAVDGELLFERMMALKRQGLVSKIGVSVYNAEQIDCILQNFTIDLIQLPINVLDQRLITSGHLAKLKKKGIEIHARSAFLQGLLLMDPAGLTAHFDSIRGHLHQYHRHIELAGLSALEAALGFVAGLDEVDAIICGVNNHQQLLELICSYTVQNKYKFERFAVVEERILNPSLWPC